MFFNEQQLYIFLLTCLSPVTCEEISTRCLDLSHLPNRVHNLPDDETESIIYFIIANNYFKYILYKFSNAILFALILILIHAINHPLIFVLYNNRWILISHLL